MQPHKLDDLSAETPLLACERIKGPLSTPDLNDLCDATEAAFNAGERFAWLELPPRDKLERYWQGVITMPVRTLFVARLDTVICGACQLVRPSINNEAQAHAAQLLGFFMAPWGHGHGLSQALLHKIEAEAMSDGYHVINVDVRENLPRQIALYEGADYEQFGRHAHYAMVDGAYVGGRYYTKKLLG